MSKLAILGGTPVIESPLPAYKSIGEAERKAVMEVLDSGCLSGFYGSPGPQFYGGPAVQSLEAAWAKRYGIKHAVSVNSATSGLFAAMAAIGISPGDEVIVPPYSMSATVMAPLAYGGIPIFADIDPDTFCIDYQSVVDALTPKSRAIIAVNLFGHPAPLKALRKLTDEKGIYLIEDNAQAPLGEENGQLCGTIGHMGVFSLNYHKHIHAGEGGVCTTNDPMLAERVALVRNHGENLVEDNPDMSPVNMVGFNLRLTEMSAAVARAQLADVDQHVERRERVADILTEGTHDLAGWTPPVVRDGCRHNFYMWSIRYDEDAIGVPREIFSNALNAEGFPNETAYAAPLYLLPAFQRRIAIGSDGFPFNLGQPDYDKGLCPVVERMWEKELLQYQPPNWDVDEEMAEKLVDAIRKVHENRHDLKRLGAD